MNRDHLRRLLEQARQAGAVAPGEGADWDPDLPADDGNPVGMPEAELHWHVDVRPVLATKRAALTAHASQEDVGWMLGMPEDQYATAFGDEWYLEPGRPDGLVSALPF